MTPRLRIGLTVGWLGVVLAVTTTPWREITTHAHWATVTWLPFGEGFRVRDEVLNFVLFVPYGMLIRRPARAVAAAALLSVAIELSQVFIHSRMSSATDVLMNTLGAAVGVAISRLRRSEPAGVGP